MTTQHRSFKNIIGWSLKRCSSYEYHLKNLQVSWYRPLRDTSHRKMQVGTVALLGGGGGRGGHRIKCQLNFWKIFIFFKCENGTAYRTFDKWIERHYPQMNFDNDQFRLTKRENNFVKVYRNCRKMWYLAWLGVILGDEPWVSLKVTRCLNYSFTF
jgi:hypothetical protein